MTGSVSLSVRFGHTGGSHESVALAPCCGTPGGGHVTVEQNRSLSENLKKKNKSAPTRKRPESLRHAGTAGPARGPSHWHGEAATVTE